MSKENPHKWFTAGEAATLARTHGIAGVPTTKSGMIRWIKRLAAGNGVVLLAAARAWRMLKGELAVG